MAKKKAIPNLMKPEPMTEKPVQDQPELVTEKPVQDQLQSQEPDIKPQVISQTEIDDVPQSGIFEKLGVVEEVAANTEDKKERPEVLTKEDFVQAFCDYHGIAGQLLNFESLKAAQNAGPTRAVAEEIYKIAENNPALQFLISAKNSIFQTISIFVGYGAFVVLPVVQEYRQKKQLAAVPEEEAEEVEPETVEQAA